MKIVKPVYYKNFKCIAGDCPDSCCQGWEVDADEASLRFYRTLDPSLEIKQRLDSVLDRDEFGNTIFRLAPKKRCPFLNDSNLCDMHIAIGAEHTPFTCRTFPRYINDYGATREIGISFSCPVAAELIYHHPVHITFEEEMDGEPPSLNDIDAMTFYRLKKAREKAFAILQNDAEPLRKRIVTLLTFAKELQKELDDYEEGTDGIDFVEVFHNPEVIHEEWVDKVRHYRVGLVENTQPNENIAVYFIHKYFLQAVYDLDVLSKVKMAAVGVLIPACFGEDSWTMHLWSKETEHSQYNMDRYQGLLRTAKCLSADELIKRFS